MNPDMKISLINYAANHIEPGGFLMALLSNDLFDAIPRLHRSFTHLDQLREIMQFVNDELPSNCWGSDKKVDAWLNVPPGTVTDLPDLKDEKIRSGIAVAKMENRVPFIR